MTRFNNKFWFITVILALLLIKVADGQFFQTQGLANKKSCAELSKNDCTFYEEAISKCASDCQNKKDDQGQTTTASSGKKKKKGCFHGDDLVQTNFGSMRISETVGQNDLQVLSRNDQGQMEYSSIYYWIHANATIDYEFLVLKTENGQKLSITKDHLIYQTDCRGSSETVFAGRVRPGKCIYVKTDDGFQESRVVSSHVTRKTGIYAPITYNGNLVVNDVLASCFVCYENEQAQKIMYSYMNMVHRFLRAVSPSVLVDLFYSNPFAGKVNVPEIVFSFWDLAKKFSR